MRAHGYWLDPLPSIRPKDAAPSVSLHHMPGRFAMAAAYVRAMGAARRNLEENVQSRLALEALLLDAPFDGLRAGSGAAITAGHP